MEVAARAPCSARATIETLPRLLSASLLTASASTWAYGDVFRMRRA